VSPPPPDPALDAYIAELVAAAPPLGPSQCHRLAVLLAPSPAVPADVRPAA
jgi:hypothetical protein